MKSPTPNKAWILLLLGSLCVVTPFAIDMYLPAFSAIAAEFRTTTSAISLSISTYFVGFALGQLFYGPLLDRFGRKRPLYLGLTVYVLCSIGCALAPNLRTFVALRFFQALGGCVAQVGAIAMVRDFFPVRESAKIFSLLFLMIGTSPLLAPTIGSMVMSGLGWRWIFALLATIATVILALMIFHLPEGHQPDHSVSLRLGATLRGFAEIFRVPQFLVFTLAGGFSFAGLITYVSGAPVIFIDGFHLSVRAFGIVFAVLVSGFIGGNQVNVLLLRRFTSQRIFKIALVSQTVIAMIFYLGNRAHLFGLAAMLVLFFLLLSCIGFTYPNGAALALARFSHNGGRASALLGFLQMGIAALISMSIGVFGSNSVVALLALGPIVALGILLAGRSAIGELVESEETETVVMH